MITFVKVKIDRKNQIYKNIIFLEQIYNLYEKHEKFLNDDFRQADLLDEVISIIERTSPFFWALLKDEQFAGFVFLENFIGNTKNKHSAEITTCFEQEYWGNFTKHAGKKFIKYCFKKLKLKKLKCLVYKNNTKVFNLLKSVGMELEAELKNETIKNGKPQDILIFTTTSYNHKERKKDAN